MKQAVAHGRLSPLARMGLRTRLTLSVMVIALLSTLCVSTVAFFYVRANTLDVLVSDQFQRTVAIAQAIDQKFVSRRLVLKTFAQALEAQQLRGTSQLQPYLLQQTVLKEVFDNVTLLDRDGVAVANFSGAGPIGTLNVSDRPYFLDTLSSHEGVISQPIRNRFSGTPQVVMTQPVRDAQGAIVYVVTALIRLDKSNFLGELADLKFGKTGYVFITNTDGIVIDSPRKTRILNHFDAEGGHNEATSRAVAGFEGSTDAVNRLGVHALYGFKRTQQTNWIVGTHYPYDEAFEVLRRLERFTVMGAVALSVVWAVLSLLVLRRQLAPLGRLHRHIVASRNFEAYRPLSKTYPADELGDLARAFDEAMTERRLAEADIAASHKLLQDIADNIPSLVARVDKEMRYTFVNAHIQDVHPGQQLIGQHLRAVRGESEFRIVEPWIEKVLAGKTVSFEKNGAPAGPNAHRCFEVTFIPDLNASGEVTGFYSMSFDITERKNAERAIAESEAKLRGVTDNLPALVSHVDAKERFTFVNAAVKEWWGLEPKALIGRSMREVVGDSVYAIADSFLQRALSGERVEFEVQRQVRGEMRDVHNVYVPDKDKTGAIAGVFTLSVNITELKSVERKLTLLARVDSLTQLANRVALNEALPLTLARAKRNADALALMYLDIDHFKMINDTLGHAAGDEVLCEFARRLQSSVRTTDIVARLGGDEFVVVLENLSDSGVAGAVAEKIVEQVARPVFEVQARPLSITTSIGIVFHAPAAPPATPSDLLARADAALYAAKARGRNRFEFAA